MVDSLREFDALEGYCRKLGHHLPFSYCRTTGTDRLCGSIRECWFQRLDIDSWLGRNFEPAVLEQALKPGTPRITGIMEILMRTGAVSSPTGGASGTETASLKGAAEVPAEG